MAFQVWCLFATLFLASVKGQIDDNVSQLSEKVGPSSPAPPEMAPSGQVAGMKEMVLYLTPEQAQALQTAGAYVKPFPQFDLIRQYQQSLEEQMLSQSQAITPNEDGKQDAGYDEFYKIVNTKPIEEDVLRQPQSGVSSTDKPKVVKIRPKTKYTNKGRNHEYSALYVQKKANRVKSPSAGYVRYLPNYEQQSLKMEPYQAQSLPGYILSNEQVNVENPQYIQTDAPKLQISEQIIKPGKGLPTVFPAFAVSSLPTDVKPIMETVSSVDNTGPVTFDDKLQESLKTWHEQKLQVPSQSWDEANKGLAQISVLAEKKNPQEVQKTSPVTDKPQAEDRDKIPSISLSFLSEEAKAQFLSLLAPLIQHEKIAESIARQKEELVKTEKQIRSKLESIKESGIHDEEKITSEIDKLKENLGKQNDLAQKVALEQISKKTQSQNKDIKADKSQDTKPIPVEQVTISKTPQLDENVKESLQNMPIKIFATPIDLLRPIPDVRAKINDKLENDGKSIVVPVTPKPYGKLDSPFIVPVEVKHEFSVQHPDPNTQGDQVILRPIWDH